MSTRCTTTLLTTALVFCVGCHSAESPDATAAVADSETPQVSTEPTPAAAPIPPAAATGTLAGTVVETMDSGGYTYVLVDTGAEQVWAAGPVIALTSGDRVSFDGSMPMAGYHSATLDRSFDRIYFTGSIDLDLPKQEAVTEVTPGPEGSVTVEEVFTRRSELVGTELVIRGEVVKFNSGIMGTNWLHIQDGTGAEGTNDLTVTTDTETVAVGDIVLVRGVLAADRDFGYGYLYDLIIEGAQVTVD